MGMATAVGARTPRFQPGCAGATGIGGVVVGTADATGEATTDRVGFGLSPMTASRALAESPILFGAAANR